MKPIRWPVSCSATFNRLAEHKHSKTHKPLFPTRRAALCFAALVGYEFNLRTPLEGDTEQLDGRLVFEHSETIETIYAIALASTRDASILQPDSEAEMVAVFEEYVHGGLVRLGDWFLETPADRDGVEALIRALRGTGHLGIAALGDESPDLAVSF